MKSLGQVKTFRAADMWSDDPADYLSVTFDTKDRTCGLWTIELENPNGQQASLSEGFEIVEGTPPHAAVNITGRQIFRAGVWTSFLFTMHNDGNVDAPGNLAVSGIPWETDHQWSLTSCGDIKLETINFIKENTMLVTLPQMVIPAQSHILVYGSLNVPDNRLFQIKAHWDNE